MGHPGTDSSLGSLRRAKPLLVGGVLLLIFGPAVRARALELDGFTEPYRTIEVAADETGLIDEMLVHEGEVVKSGQPLARLNSDVFQAMLAIAEQGMVAEGRLDAAQADLQLRRQRLEKLDALRVQGHARQEEVDRARAEVTVAEANLRAVREEQLLRRLEYDKIKVQLERRTVRAPLAGVVTRTRKEPGEFVAANSPELLTLVQLDPLVAVFSVTSRDAGRVQLERKVTVKLPQVGRDVAGVVEFISPVNDAESGTVRIKVRIDNPEHRWRSGERCSLHLPDPSAGSR